MTTPRKIGGSIWKRRLTGALRANRQARETIQQAHEIIAKILDNETLKDDKLALLLSEASQICSEAFIYLAREQDVWVDLMEIIPMDDEE